MARGWFVPEILLIASCLPIIPQISDQLYFGPYYAEGGFEWQLTALALVSMIASTAYMWLVFRTPTDKSMERVHAYLVVSAPVIIAPIALYKTESPSGAALVEGFLFGLIFPAFLLILQDIQARRKKEAPTLVDKVTGKELFKLYLYALVVYLVVLFLFTIWVTDFPKPPYFWRYMGESWIRALYFLGLLVHSSMVFLLTLVGVKFGIPWKTLVPRLIIAAVLVFLCLEAHDSIEYYYW